MIKSSYTEEFDFVAEKYADDFNLSVLNTQLELFSVCYNEAAQGSSNSVSLPEMKNYFTSLSPAIRCSLSEVYTLFTIVMVMPGTNAVSERSASESALRRVKTYLRTTMGQSRLNNLMTLHIHKEFTDNLVLTDCLNDSVVESDHRLTVFGRF